jgi:hypothetical protein
MHALPTKELLSDKLHLESPLLRKMRLQASLSAMVPLAKTAEEREGLRIVIEMNKEEIEALIEQHNDRLAREQKRNYPGQQPSSYSQDTVDFEDQCGFRYN